MATHNQSIRYRNVAKATKLSEVRKMALKCSIIGIDEGQFFEDLVEFSNDMANRGKTVIVAALDGTFEKKPFENVMNLIPHSESVIKLTSVCMACMQQAAFTRRLTDE